MSDEERVVPFAEHSYLRGERRTIIRSLRLRGSHVPSSSLRDSEEIRAMPGACQVVNPPAYKLLPKISLPLIWRVREPSLSREIDCGAGCRPLAITARHYFPFSYFSI